LQAQKKTSVLGNKGDDTTDSERDDADAGRDVATQLFSVPDDYYADWRENLSVYLTASEAAFLRKMIETSVADSLLVYLLKNNIDVTKYDSFEDVYEDLKEEIPSDLNEKMKLACDFNRLVYVARVRYNHILSNGQNDDAVAEWEFIEDNMAYMISVDIDEVLRVLNITNFRLRRFLTTFKNALLTGDLEAADKALVDREVEIKTRSRAKLCRRDDYANDTWIGGRYLDYRLFSAKRIITDIYHGEEGSHV
jgi:hypothetical protein